MSEKISSLCVFSVPFSTLVLISVLGDVDAVEVVGSESAVALRALPLSGVVTHLQTFVAEDVETLGEHRLLVSCVAAGAAQLGLRTDKCVIYEPNTDTLALLLHVLRVVLHFIIVGVTALDSQYPPKHRVAVIFSEFWAHSLEVDVQMNRHQSQNQTNHQL